MGNQMLAGNNVEFFVQECNVLFLNCNAAQIQASPAKCKPRFCLIPGVLWFLTPRRAVSELVSKYTSIVVDVDALSAVYPLKTAVEKLRRSPEHLTAVHAEFVKVRPLPLFAVVCARLTCSSAGRNQSAVLARSP